MLNPFARSIDMNVGSGHFLYFQTLFRKEKETQLPRMSCDSTGFGFVTLGERDSTCALESESWN